MGGQNAALPATKLDLLARLSLEFKGEAGTGWEPGQTQGQILSLLLADYVTLSCLFPNSV